jgi:type IV secretion system protein VirD4
MQNNINVQKFSKEIFKKSKVKSDPFWDRAEQNLLKALVLYMATKYSERERNLTNVYSFLDSLDLKQIDIIFRGLPNGHPAKIPYNVYAQASDTIKTSTLIGLKTRLQMSL